jgi:hypothetical protein
MGGAMGKVLSRDWVRTRFDIDRLNTELGVRKGEFNPEEATAIVVARVGHPTNHPRRWAGFCHEVRELSAKKESDKTVERRIKEWQRLADNTQAVASAWIGLFDAVAALAAETGKPAFWSLVRQLVRGKCTAHGIHWSGTRASFLRGIVWERSDHPTRFREIDPAFWVVVDAARWFDVERDAADHAVAVVVDPFTRVQKLERYTQIRIGGVTTPLS